MCSLSTAADDFAEFDEFDDEFSDAKYDEAIHDPLVGLNRVMFVVNDKLYFWVMNPLATSYKKITPDVFRIGVRNFFDNAAFPIRLVNNTLQFKFRRAGTEISRFGINTTIGILGFHDVATKRYSLVPFNEDFGQTLGHYGFWEGFPLTLPVFGPSNVRDLLGLVPDYFLNPATYIDPSYASTAVKVYDTTNRLSLRLGQYENLKKDAIDPYTFFRNAYKKRRTSLIEE